MPRYQVTLDGKTFVLEGDHPPSEAEARAALGQSVQHAASPSRGSGESIPALQDFLSDPVGFIGRKVLEHPIAAGATAGALLAVPTGGTSLLPAMAAAGLGGAGGAGVGSIVNAAVGNEGGPKTASDVAATMAKEGALAAAGQGVGQIAGNVIGKGAYRIYKGVLRPSIPLQREFGDIAQTGLNEGAAVSDAGAKKITGRLVASGERGNQMVANAAANGAANVPVATLEQELQPLLARAQLRATTGLPDESAGSMHTIGIQDRINALRKSYPSGVPINVAQTLKRELQDMAAKVYRAADRGAPMTDLGADTNAALATGLRKGIEQEIPGIADVNSRTQGLIGLQHALENAQMRNVHGVGFHAFTGDLMPAAASQLAIGAHTAAPYTPTLLRALVTALGGDQ